MLQRVFGLWNVNEVFQGDQVALEGRCVVGTDEIARIRSGVTAVDRWNTEVKDACVSIGWAPPNLGKEVAMDLR